MIITLNYNLQRTTFYVLVTEFKISTDAISRIGGIEIFFFVHGLPISLSYLGKTL